MNQAAKQLHSASRALVQRWPWALGLTLVVLALAGPLSGGDVQNGGAAPYTPTQGEWLCLLLNTQEALFASEQQPDNVAIRYCYDRAQPNKIHIDMLYGANVNALELRRQAKAAEDHAMELAKLRGCDKWLKLDMTRTLLPGRPEPQILER
jgi:hypothetical protein